MIDPNKPDYGNTPVNPKRPKFEYRLENPGAPPVVTFVTPFHNTGEIFNETARCIFAQSLQQWEWIIVNDASTDRESLDVLDQYRGREPQIRVIDNAEKKGPGAARNAGFEAARSNYIYTLDSDDLIEPTTIEKTFWFLESFSDYGFVHSLSVGFGAEEYLWTKGYHNNEEFLQENLATGRSMVRKSAHVRGGGYDASILGGFEDWDFWLRCANVGIWGSTIPEYLDWYRRRENHHEAWKDWDKSARQGKFRERLKVTYPNLYAGKFPQIQRPPRLPFESLPNELPAENRLAKAKRRVVMIVPWFAMGGSDKYTLDLLQQLSERGFEVTLAATIGANTGWMPEFARYTPDIFVLNNFLRPCDQPRFLRYLIQSRQPDLVLITQSEMGYMLLPYLRAHCPEPAYADYCHMEEEYWKNGGYPRYAVGAQPQLDLNMVSSAHLKHWMAERGAAPERIEINTTNIDPKKWSRRGLARESIREHYKIPDDGIVICFAARICEQKQPNVLAETLLKLKKLGCDYWAFICGDGPDKPELDHFLRHHHLANRVHALGAVTNDEVLDYMSASDIFFLPSRWEGIALSMFEAMSMELAAVGADVGGQKELVTPDCGVLIERGTPDAEASQYAQELAGLIRNPRLCREMGERARRRIEESFQLKHMGDRAVKLIDRAIELHRASPRRLMSPEFAVESATRAMEYLRVCELADWLWAERERVALAQHPATLAQARSSAGAQRPMTLPSERIGLPLEEELRLIENSVAWRLYKALGKIGLASNASTNGAALTPQERLNAITSTPYYQRVQAIRRSKMYKFMKKLRGKN